MSLPNMRQHGHPKPFLKVLQLGDEAWASMGEQIWHLLRISLVLYSFVKHYLRHVSCISVIRAMYSSISPVTFRVIGASANFFINSWCMTAIQRNNLFWFIASDTNQFSYHLGYALDIGKVGYLFFNFMPKDI